MVINIAQDGTTGKIRGFGYNEATTALDECSPRLNQQRDDLKSVRDRAVAMLGVGSLTASVAAGLSSEAEGQSPSCWAYAAGGCIVVLVFITLGIAKSYTVTFRHDIAVLVGWTDNH